MKGEIMPYGIKKLLEIEAEKKAKREEREKLKKEQKIEKERLKKLEHKKKLKKKQNKRAYNKRRKAELAERAKIGDEKGYYSLYITKNRKKIRSLGKVTWKSAAYQKFNDAIEKNRENTHFPKTLQENSKERNKDTELKYEILLIKKVNEGENTTASFRNEDGKYIDNIIEGCNTHIILEKADWFVEETFQIYGLHPQKQKKPYTYILNDMILPNVDNPYDMKRVMIYHNKLIIQYLEDFDFIVCYNELQCEKLYDKLQSDLEKMKKKYVVFMGHIVPQLVSEWIERFEDKTGWTRASTMQPYRKY